MTTGKLGVFLGAVAFSAMMAGGTVASEKAGWGYEGEIGPDNWGTLDGKYAACSLGKQQSPVDLRAAIPADIANADVHWRTSRLDVVNNGHTIQVNTSPGSFMVLEGRRFDLLQFHFHAPSEHILEGEPFPLEVHFVHQSAEGDLAVVGVFLMAGEANPLISAIWDVAPADPGEVKTNTVIRPTDLLPSEAGAFRYAGSLTTPPCSEVVSWVVLDEPVEMSEAQIEAFLGIYSNNARPVQRMFRRFLLSIE